MNWLKRKIINKYVASIVRTALAALGGFLVAKYGLDEDLVNQLMTNIEAVITAIAPIIVAQIWSLIQKYMTD